MRLVIQSGSELGRAFEITKDATTIGRGSGSDVVLSDLSVSRNHCQIRLQGSDFVIQDLGSVNGTFVNNEQITAPKPLRAGDVIKLGQTTLSIEEGEPATVLQQVPSDMVPPAVSVPAQVGLRTRWALIGAGIGGLAIIGLLFMFAMFSQRVPAPTLVAAQSTNATPAASVTRSPALAATLAPPTGATPTSAPATSAASVTSTVFANPEATITLTPTPMPTSTPTKFYAEPRVLLPEPKKKLTINEQVAFSWIAVGTLRPLDLYRVQVSRDPDFVRIACEIRSKETFVTLPGEGAVCNDKWQFNNRYFWRVQVVVQDVTGNEQVLTPQTGQVNEFAWAP